MAVAVERGVKMIWWAIEQRRKEREKLVKDALAKERARISKELELMTRGRNTPITVEEVRELLLKETTPE